MATLWKDYKLTEFLNKCGANLFKIIQISKGRRKLVGYFKNWETTLRALNTPQVFLPEGKVSDSNQKDKQQSSTKAPKNNNQLKKPKVQKKTKNISKNKGGNKDNKEVLAEILSLLQKLV
ncbi:hypothetical protein C1646_666226 [Rhizophagus diaphanus]|nr:hypothetical protein C1646_666226 [Rhizophagus diaphanus] [Rhizophagus sp. MUCL 43196]